MPTATDISDIIAHSTGSENFYRHFTRKLIYTDGIHALSEAGCAWLVDIVASYQGDKRLTPCDGFQIWTLTVNDDKSAKVVCQRDIPGDELITQRIPFTDFPLKSIKLYCEYNGEVWTLMIPSER